MALQMDKRSCLYNSNNTKEKVCENPWQISQNPICTGASVIGIVFDGGVAIVADCLASYGRMAMFKGVSRLMRVNSRTLLGVGGDYADYQYLQSIIETKQAELECLDPGSELSPVALHSWLTTVLYNRRSKMNPLWNNFIVCGWAADGPFLGVVNKLGVAYRNPYISTGLGTFLAQQMLENAIKEKQAAGGKLSEEEAVKLLKECMTTLFTRDCLAHDQYELGIVTAKGCKILGKQTVTGNFILAPRVLGYE